MAEICFLTVLKAQIYFLTALKAQSLKSRCRWRCAPQRRGSVQLLASPGVPRLVVQSSLWLHSTWSQFFLWASKDRCVGFRIHRYNPGWPHFKIFQCICKKPNAKQVHIQRFIELGCGCTFWGTTIQLITLPITWFALEHEERSGREVWKHHREREMRWMLKIC